MIRDSIYIERNVVSFLKDNVKNDTLLGCFFDILSNVVIYFKEAKIISVEMFLDCESDNIPYVLFCVNVGEISFTELSKQRKEFNKWLFNLKMPASIHDLFMFDYSREVMIS